MTDPSLLVILSLFAPLAIMAFILGFGSLQGVVAVLKSWMIWLVRLAATIFEPSPVDRKVKEALKGPPHLAGLLEFYPAWLLDMAAMVKASDEPDYHAFHHLLSCDNDKCGKMNPSKHCSRCQTAYYCSDKCQRFHWQHGHQSACQSAVTERTQWLKDWAELTDSDDVTDDAFEKARILLKRVEMMLDDTDVAGRRDLCQQAMMEIDEVLKVDRGNNEARRLRADILKHLDPVEAIQMYKKIVDETRALMGPKAQEQFRNNLEQGLWWGLDEQVQSVAHNLEYMSRSDLHLCPCQVGLAQSYKAAGWYKRSLFVYQCLWDDVKWNGAPAGLDLLKDIKLGMARSCFQLCKYDEAISAAEPFVMTLRHVAGGHQLVAKALLAKAEKTNGSGATLTNEKKKYSATLADAVEIMYKAIVYEAPWNETNKRANRLFLQELLDKVQVVNEAESVDVTTTTQDNVPAQTQPVGRRSRKNKTRAAKKAA